MKRSLRIAVADDERDMRDFLQRVLPIMGHEVVAVAATGKELVEQCHATPPDLIITDIKMPDMDGIEAAADIWKRDQIPIILVSAYHDPALIERAANVPVLTYLVKPVEQADLEPAIAIAMRRFAEIQSLSKAAADLRQALEDRKVIERAKGTVMKKAGISEDEAFRRMQKLARDSNKTLIEIARSVLTAAEALEPSGDGTSHE